MAYKKETLRYLRRDYHFRFDESVEQPKIWNMNNCHALGVKPHNSDGQTGTVTEIGQTRSSVPSIMVLVAQTCAWRMTRVVSTSVIANGLPSYRRSRARAPAGTIYLPARGWPSRPGCATWQIRSCRISTRAAGLRGPSPVGGAQKELPRNRNVARLEFMFATGDHLSEAFPIGR